MEKGGLDAFSSG